MNGILLKVDTWGHNCLFPDRLTSSEESGLMTDCRLIPQLTTTWWDIQGRDVNLQLQGWAGWALFFKTETIRFLLRWIFHPDAVSISCRFLSLYTRGRWSPRYCTLGLEKRIQGKAEKPSGCVPGDGTSSASWRFRYCVCTPRCSDS